MNNKRFIYEQQWTDSGRVSEADFSRLYLSQPTKIGPAITYMFGKDNISLNPITYMTEGKGVYGEPLNGMDYEYDVMSTLEKRLPLAEAVSSGTPGIGNSTFIIKFRERHFSRDYTIFSPNKYQLRIVDDPVQNGSLWNYKVQLVTGNPAAYVPLSELVEGTFFTKGMANVAPFDSRGNESQITGFAKVRGNIGFIRKSFRWAGNIPNKTMTVEFANSKMFWPFQQYQIERQWQMEVENAYMYSVGNRSDDGIFPMKDHNNNSIIIGDGLLEQIGNKDNYGVLSFKKLEKVIRDVYTGMKDAQNKRIELW